MADKKKAVITSIVTVTKVVVLQAEIEVNKNGQIGAIERKHISNSIMNDFKSNWNDDCVKEIKNVSVKFGII